jgi:hypothetical protein
VLATGPSCAQLIREVQTFFEVDRPHRLVTESTGTRLALHHAGWKALESHVAPYRSGKDSVVFPHSREIPYDLVSRVAAAIVRDRET